MSKLQIKIKAKGPAGSGKTLNLDRVYRLLVQDGFEVSRSQKDEHTLEVKPKDPKTLMGK